MCAHRVLLLSFAACTYTPPVTGTEELPPVLAFEYERSGGDEGLTASGLVITVPVVLSRASDTDVTATVTPVAGGQATPDVDFTLASTEVTITAGELRAEIMVTIVRDLDEAELEESFELELSAPQGAVLDNAKTLHRVTIADHLLPRIEFMSASTSSAEDVPSTLTLTLTSPAEGESTVFIGVTGGLPDPGDSEDVGLSDQVAINIPGGALSVTVPILELDDLLDEPDTENLVFGLKGASPNLVLGTTIVATHTLTDDDDPPTAQFMIDQSSIAENGTTATLIVTLSGESQKRVVVTYSRNAVGTASAGDATVNLTQVSFAPHAVGVPGETMQVITVTITDDTTDENAETLTVDLTGATNATLGPPLAHALTILADAADPAPTVQFNDIDDTVDEDNVANNGVTNVQLSAISGKTVTVTYVTNALSTAVSGDDYINFSATGTFTILPDNLTPATNLTIDVVSNSPSSESNETVILDLANPTNATLGAATTYTLTITE